MVMLISREPYSRRWTKSYLDKTLVGLIERMTPMNVCTKDLYTAAGEFRLRSPAMLVEERAGE